MLFALSYFHGIRENQGNSDGESGSVVRGIASPLRRFTWRNNVPKEKLIAALPALAIVSVLLAPAMADEIVMANGDRLTGKIVRKESDTLVLATSYAGDVTVKWADIRRISADGPVAVYFEDGSKLSGTMRPTGDGMVIVTSGELTSAPTPLAELRFINPSAEVSGEGAKVTGHINAGLSSSSGNSQTTKIYLDTEGAIRSRDDRYTLGVRGARTDDRDVQSESNWLGYAKYDHFFTKKWYGYGNGDFEYDRFKDIRLRSTLGLGSSSNPKGPTSHWKGASPTSIPISSSGRTTLTPPHVMR